MKYLSFMASYTGSCLKDDYNTEFDVDNYDLPKRIVEKINTWNKKYSKIIPLSTEDRTNYIREIEELDNEGLKICSELKEIISEEVKIRYFSEGKLKYLN